MTVDELVRQLNNNCSKGITVRVSADGEYYSLNEIKVDYENTTTENEAHSEVFATITTYDTKNSGAKDDPWLGDYKPDYKRLYDNLSQAIVKGFAALENCDDAKISSSKCVAAFRTIIEEQYGASLETDIKNYRDSEK